MRVRESDTYLAKVGRVRCGLDLKHVRFYFKVVGDTIESP